MLTSQDFLLGMRYDAAVVRAQYHGVQKMRESSTYQAILEEGYAKGWAEGEIAAHRDVLLTIRDERFKAVPSELVSRILATTDSARLQTAIRQAIHIASPDDLRLCPAPEFLAGPGRAGVS
jgi:predicted transposase YdaD